MTSSAHQLPNPYPYQIGPWNNGKFQKISPNITDESSPLPNHKSYLIESNLSPPIVNIKAHLFFQINWFSTLGIQFRIHSAFEYLLTAQNQKNRISLPSSHSPHTPTVNIYTENTTLPELSQRIKLLAIKSNSSATNKLNSLFTNLILIDDNTTRKILTLVRPKLREQGQFECEFLRITNTNTYLSHQINVFVRDFFFLSTQQRLPKHLITKQ